MRLIFLYRRHHLKWRDDLQNVSQQFQIEANLELVNLWMDVEVLLSPKLATELISNECRYLSPNLHLLEKDPPPNHQ